MAKRMIDLPDGNATEITVLAFDGYVRVRLSRTDEIRIDVLDSGYEPRGTEFLHSAKAMRELAALLIRGADSCDGIARKVTGIGRAA